MKYFRLTLAQFRYWFMRIFEFRSEVILWSVNNVIWAMIFVAVVNLMFREVSTIAGWGKTDVLMLMVTQEMFLGILWCATIPSLLMLSATIRTGNLDGYLLKPVPSQFLVSTMKFEFDNYPRVAAMIIVLWVTLIRNHIYLTLGQIAGYVALLVTGLVIFYSIFFLLTTSAFWLTQIFNLEDLFDSMLSVGKYPVYIFDKSFRFIFLFILPTAYVATFPVEMLRGQAGTERIFLGLALAVIFLIISNRFWLFALKYYTSASS